MGFIETIRKNKSAGFTVAAVLLLLASVVAFVSAHSGRIPSNLTRAFYSDDDGKTFFVDNLDKAYPFDHNGQQAYRAYVFKGASGSAFVAYLERYTASGLAQKQALLANPIDDGGAAASLLLRSATEVRKPGQTKWVPGSSQARLGVVNVDDATAREVYP
jgi:hypothetical protein